MLHGLPDATVTGFSTSENPHFNMFTLDRPTCLRNRLSAFQVVQGFSAPAGRCSSALMLRCTLTSSGSSLYLHRSNNCTCQCFKTTVRVRFRCILSPSLFECFLGANQDSVLRRTSLTLLQSEGGDNSLTD